VCSFSVLRTGRKWGALAAAGISGVLARSVFDLPWSITILLIIIGLFYGYALLSMVAVVVEISCATLFICFALEPDAMIYRHPTLHQDLISSWEKRKHHLPSFFYKKKKKEKKKSDGNPQISKKEKKKLKKPNKTKSKEKKGKKKKGKK